jgi:hypothetical protein
VLLIKPEILALRLDSGAQQGSSADKCRDDAAGSQLDLRSPQRNRQEPGADF